MIEFGAGTGAMTERLLDVGVDAKDLILVETNPEFCAFLKARYPGADIVKEDAFSAIRSLRGVAVRGALSSLPLVQFPRAERLRFIHRAINTLMQPNARISQFTYGYGSPLPLTGNPRLKVEASGRVWLNLWPARVWAYSRAVGV